MHEMSLVQDLLQQLSDLAVEHRMTKVLKITMEIGPLSGIVVDSFTFGFEALAPHDPLVKDAELIIETPPAAYTCSSCGHRVETTETRPEKCPECEEPFLIASGSSDLILKNVEME